MIFLFYSLSLLNSMGRRRILQKCSVYKLFEFQTLEFEKTDLLLLQPRNFDWLTFWIRNMSHLLLYRISCFYIKQQRTLNPNSRTWFKRASDTVQCFHVSIMRNEGSAAFNSLKVSPRTRRPCILVFRIHLSRFIYF